MPRDSVLSIVLLAGIVPHCIAQAPKQALAPANQPALIARGNDYFIHAIRPIKTQNVLVETASSDDAMLVHTSLKSGEMKVLVRGATTVTRVPMGIDRIHYHESSIVDFVADKERLYVFKLDTTFTELADRPMGGIRGGGQASHAMLVFQANTGALLYTLEVTQPAEDATKRVRAGTLKLRDNGVEVFGTRYEFKGLELIKPRPKATK